MVEFDLVPAALIWEIQNPNVLVRCLELLEQLRQRIKAKGINGENDGSILMTIYGDPKTPCLRPTLQASYLDCLNTTRLTEEERARRGFATPEQCNQIVLQKIGAEIDRLKLYQVQHELYESERTNLEILRQSVPDSPALDGLL